MDKDTWIAQNLFPKNEAPQARVKRQGVTSVNVFNATRKTKITLCVLGSWAIYMPPYNLARLTSLIRESGFHTNVYDYNVDSHYRLKEANPALEDAWNGANYWWWQDPEYYTRIHPTYQPILDEYIDNLIADKPDIIGFSCYYTNIFATRYAIEKIRTLAPEITIIMGGPECHEKYFKMPNGADYYFIGESEQNIIDFLNNWEKGIKPKEKSIGSLYSDTRIDIDSLPYPDYSDFDLTRYLGKNSICAEISRGCVAKCTYCTEVYYWKFRDRGALTVVDELEYQVKKYGISFVSFVDSLMNGNLKEFRRFCEEIIKRDLKINWWGYARADGRMDLNFYQTMANAGAQGFNYGIESGSDKVLKAINKKNTVAEINQNIIDSDKVGMKVSACWVIGAPGEDIEAFNHSFNMIWNHKHRIFAVSPGPGLGDNPGSAYDDREKFNINERNKPWLGGWWTKDLSNTKLHRHMRIKLMHIWLEICKEFGGTLHNVHRVGDQISEHYDLKFDNDYIQNHVEYENFDYNIVKTGQGNFADTVMSEVFGLFRLLWRVKGGFEMTIRFNPELDHRDFIFAISPDSHDYESTCWFKIDDDGNYQTRIESKFRNEYKDVVDMDGFEYVFEQTGHWKESEPTRTQKVLWIKPEISALQSPAKLPIENCFANISVDDRKLLYRVSKILPENSVIVDNDSGLGGTTCILASANPSSTVYGLERFHSPHIQALYGSVSQWIDGQIADWCVENNHKNTLGHDLVREVKELMTVDPTGRKSWIHLASNYRNITLLQDHADMFADNSVDLYVQNHCSDNPYLMDKLSYWLPKIKSKGYLVIQPFSNDVSTTVDELITNDWKLVEKKENIVVLRRL